MRRFAKPRQPTAGRMNKTEERYLNEVLRPLLYVGQVLDIKFEGLKLRLADNTFYTPDFVVVRNECIEIHEVKGHWEDDARVKIKVAAQMFPWLRFIAVQHKDKKWVTEEF